MAEQYQIHVKGQLDSYWSTWLAGFTINPQADGRTILQGPLPDQAALHGLLARIRDLGIPILLVLSVDYALMYQDELSNLIK